MGGVRRHLNYATVGRLSALAALSVAMSGYPPNEIGEGAPQNS
jgi:hypothetical protein